MTVNLDAVLHNADWTKTTPDLPYKTRKDLLAFLQRQEMSLEQFKTLPCYYLAKDHWDKVLSS